jgi:hypothetical protein
VGTKVQSFGDSALRDRCTDIALSYDSSAMSVESGVDHLYKSHRKEKKEKKRKETYIRTLLHLGGNSPNGLCVTVKVSSLGIKRPKAGGIDSN